MKKCRWFCLGLTLLLLVASCKSTKNDQGLILYQTLDEDGQPKELIVVNPKGEEQHRIELVDWVRSGIPTRANHQALLDTPEKVYLVNVEQGTIQALELEEGVYPYAAQFRYSGGGKRWMLMGNPQGNLTYLVNLETGKTYDMTTLDEDAPFIFYGLFAPDEEHLVLGIGSDLWLVPTADPKDARRLGAGRTTFASSFSHDGKRIAYVQRNDADEFEVVLEGVDGSEPEVAASDSFIGSVTFVPNQDQLILVTGENVSLLSLDDGKEQELLKLSGRTRRPWLAPSGKKFLLNEDTDNGMSWHLVDLKEGTDQMLDDLQDYTAYWWDPDHRWLFLVDDVSLGEGGRNLMSLDLESGEINQAMRLDEATGYFGMSAVSSTGKFGLVPTTTQDKKMQLWLLRAEGSESRLLGEGGTIHGAFSPDGRWVAVSTVDRTDDDQVQTRLVLMETEGEETRLLGEGVRPIWVRP